MGVQYLTQDNFHLQNGGKSMVCDLGGVCLIMFKSENCSHCRTLFPIFTRVSSKDHRVTYACVDVGNNRNVIGMSKTTKAPITSVPLILLYVEGKLRAKYKGPNSEDSILSFIDQMLNKFGLSQAPIQGMQMSQGYTNRPPPTSNVSFGGGGGGGGSAQPSNIPKAAHNAPWKNYVKDGAF